MATDSYHGCVCVGGGGDFTQTKQKWALIICVLSQNYQHFFFSFLKNKIWCILEQFARETQELVWAGGGGSQLFFQVGVCRPDFRSVGLANCYLPLKLHVNWKFQNFWACELKINKFPNLGACELKFGQKLRLWRQKFPNFLKRGSCELTLLLKMGPFWTTGEAWKGGLQGRTSPYPFLGQCPPREWLLTL